MTNYHKTIVRCNRALCNEIIYVTTTHTAMKQFTKEFRLLPQNSLCGNFAHYHVTLFIGIGLVATKVYNVHYHEIIYVAIYFTTTKMYVAIQPTALE
jgi:hypothetical protein